MDIDDGKAKVVFAKDASDEPTIEVVWLRPELRSLNIVRSSSSGISVSDGAFTLLATVKDRQTRRNRIPREAFEMLDANNDGALEENEIPDGVPAEFSFAELDTDNDGKLTYQEVNRAPMTAAPPAS